MKKVSNPLTIVAIFAGLAEIAGTTVLPFVTPELQKIFIWYVMGLPILLVILFFITWNFNSKVLYSPNDFSDEKNYMETLKIFYNAKQKVEKGKQSGKADSDIVEELYSDISNEIERIDGVGHNIIKILSEKTQGMTLNEIAKVTQYSKITITKKLDILQKTGIVHRTLGKIETWDGAHRRAYFYKLSKNS